MTDNNASAQAYRETKSLPIKQCYGLREEEAHPLGIERAARDGAARLVARTAMASRPDILWMANKGEGRAMAAMTWLRYLPRATSCRYRVHSRA
jgi:hypothetical protein